MAMTYFFKNGVLSYFTSMTIIIIIKKKINYQYLNKLPYFSYFEHINRILAFIPFKLFLNHGIII